MIEASRLLIFIPTYNEAENVEAIYREISDLHLEADFLFLDDNSPDGTGKIVDCIAASNPHVNVLHRSGKLGIGSAHVSGIRWAYEHNYSRLLTMDCDFTHRPTAIPSFLEHGSTYDVVLGSRFIRENSLPGWNLFRRALTYFGHFMTRLILGMPLDATGAFRLYRLDRIPPALFDLVESRGYSFFFESLYIIWLNRLQVKEIHVSLPARTQGHSKMVIKDAIHSYRALLNLRRRRNSIPESLYLAKEAYQSQTSPAKIKNTEGNL